MLLLAYSVIILFCINFVSATGITLTSDPPSGSVVLGGSVTFKCAFSTHPGKSVILWKHNLTTDIAENCAPYPSKHDRFKLVCYPREAYLSYINFTVSSVEWKDRGTWSCSYKLITKSVQLKVVVPPVIQSITILDKDKEVIAGYPPVIRSSASRIVLLGQNSAPRPLTSGIRGKGIKGNPYNLIAPQTQIKLKCSTQCGYPPPKLRWIYRNSTMQSELTSPSNMSQDFPCTDPKLNGMFASNIRLDINCKNLNLYGLIRLECSTNGDVGVFTSGIAALTEKDSSVFILCPGATRPESLTRGEFVAISVGCCLFVMILILLVFLFKHRPKQPKLASSDTEIML